MGTDDRRCPSCDKFGSPKLEGYCKTCFEIKYPGMNKDVFLEEFFQLTKDYPETGRKALLEVYPIGEVKKPKDVRPPDRKIVLGIVERRLPLGVGGHIVMDENPMCSEGWATVSEPESYAIEKENYEIE